ncbi:alpha/beta-hydrolase [Myriangium duriaei CBS 260.36]|uniref:Alpha/beta-hydrolase n=1 Tax=Myriangium duriaei CBS 260.36 TaxID=1168546 RepID=A0A9P4J8M8_9PEZI|nr:alpha/beta-hydrolase [Myriangium duriaei CBS 260.36]
MSSAVFALHEHTLPCSYIRGYSRATVDGTDSRLQLAVKQYVPLDNPDPQPGDVTILGAHANGFPKELYEPLWDDLYHSLAKLNIRIRGIWISDVAWQGYSSVLNEDKLGNDPNWLDHSLDLLLLVNHFAPQMPRPIVGVGHSMGGCQLTNLSLIHPRLFTSLILIDPVISRSQGGANWRPARASAGRRDLWPSRAAAKTAFAKSKFYQTWDPRVLERWMEHGLRDLPTAIYPESSSLTTEDDDGDDTEDREKQVTLRTTKHNEVHSFVRPAYRTPTAKDGPNRPPTSASHPELFVTGGAPPSEPFYRPEPGQTFARLPHLRPATLYVFGAKSDLSGPSQRADKLACTGIGMGGSGGVRAGRVKEVLVDAGHLVPMEKVQETADAAAEWIGNEVGRWKEEEAEVRRELEGVDRRDRARMSEGFMKALKGDWGKGAKL